MLTIVVKDEPVPQGSKSAFARRKAGEFTGGAVIVDDNSPRLKNWREAVRGAVQEAMDGRPPIEGPVVLAVTFTVPKPKSAPKRKVTWPEKRPDLDKLLRSIMDALTAGGAYRDDAQVIEVTRLGKFYPDTAAVVIPGTAAVVMTSITGTGADVLNSPGVVIRVAGIRELEETERRLGQAGT